MAATSNCQECGAELAPDAPDGACPACALRSALSPGSKDTGGESPLDNPALAVSSAVKYFGDYEILAEIARGGMGVVYRARQVSLNRSVALKMILSGRLANEAEVKRFVQEAQAAANLNHPNIVAVYEVGSHEGRHYYSMEFIDGRNLAELVRKRPLPAAKAAQYVRTIAEATHFAHERGTLHRDLKPTNILIDAFDEPRITDFGLARMEQSDPHLTSSGEIIGTPAFMSPEQAAARPKEVGPRSDIYSIGAMLYFVLTQRPPFTAASRAELLALVLGGEPVSPRNLNPSVPRDLETICLKCLQKEPDRRYLSAQELADDLGRFTRGEPILARPAGAAEKAWRWCARNRALAGSLGVASLLLAINAITLSCNAHHSVRSQNGFSDGFEGYTGFPTNWYHSAGNSEIHVENSTAHSGTNSLEMFGILDGCWGSVVSRQLNINPPWQLVCYVKNGAERGTGCHPVLGSIGLTTGPNWLFPGLGLVDFRAASGETNQLQSPFGMTVGTFNTNEWYKITILYKVVAANQVSVTCWLDDGLLSSRTYTNTLAPPADFTYLQLAAYEGTAWFDDISVSRAPSR